MRNYMKKKESRVEALSLSADELIEKMLLRNKKLTGRVLKSILALAVAVPVICAAGALKSAKSIDDIDAGTISLAAAPISAASSKKDVISIPTGTVKANPFLPYRDIGGTSVSDIPNYELIEPPEAVNENSDAARVMDTIVSGILYDKYSPSAILNIEGNDYLVKKGDVVNNYKVMNIAQDSVTVKLGNNVYKAGIGEILTEGEVTHNDVSNLSKKFGGERR